MNSQRARDAIGQALATIAPEADLGQVGGDDPLREVLDLDSLDFLSLVENLDDLTGVSIPETEYNQISTLDALTTYLVTHSH